MEYIPETPQSANLHPVAKILCCECGTPIEPNAANLCVGCIRTKVDITADIAKQSDLHMCRFCDRYLQPPDTWVHANLESKELLSICLKRLKDLKKVRLIDAGFVWTEPHSKRLKIKLTIQKEVMGGAILQQVFIVEFVIRYQMCDDCRRVENKDFWRAVVQVRQKCDHKKTLFYLEQLVLKHKAHTNTTGIKPMHGGLDFYYAKRQDAWKMVEFISSVLPCRTQHAEELISHDTKNNTFDYKNTYSLEIVPVCKDNIVCLSKKMAHSLGNIGQLSVCLRVSNVIHLIDPQTGQIAELNSDVYWRDPFQSLCLPRQLTEYTVIDVEAAESRLPGGHGAVSEKHMMAHVLVSRSHELGREPLQQFWCRTHLGYLLKPGDLALGFDFLNSNINNEFFEKMKKDAIPDVILVKKVYDRSLRNKKRIWKLKRLDENRMETASEDNDFNEFVEDLEEDPTIRQNVNIFKDKRRAPQIPVEMADDDDEDIPKVSLQEMLDDLHLSDTEMADAE